jgi:hypothetical protein
VVRVPGYRSGGPGFDSRHYRKSNGSGTGPLSLVSATEKLLESKSSGFRLETQNTAVGILHADHVALSIRKKLALTSLTSSGRSVGIVRLRTETIEFFYSD